MASSRTRARTFVPCVSRRILNHCATREARLFLLSYSFCCWAYPVVLNFSVTVFFSSKIFIWFFFVSFVSLLRLFIFPFISRMFFLTSWSTFYSNYFEVLVNSSTLLSWHWYQLIILSHVSWGFSSFFVCWVILAWSWIYDYYIMRLLVLFKSYGECCHLCCSRHSTDLSADSKSQPAFCEFQYQLRFQSLHGALQICPCVSLRGQCGTLAVFSPEVQYSESPGCCLGFCLHMLISGLSPGAHTRSTGLFSWASPAPQSPQSFPVPGAPSVWFFSQKAGALFLLFCFILPGT